MKIPNEQGFGEMPPLRHPWQLRFERAVKLSRYAMLLHGTLGTSVLMLGLAFPASDLLVSFYKLVIELTNPLFGMVRAIESCASVSAHAMAISCVVFLTGHVLILAWVYRGWWGTWSAHAVEKRSSPIFQLRSIDWLFWMPAGVLLGCGAYWVAYFEIADGTAVTCAGDPLTVWFFRMGFTSVVPFFALAVVGPVFDLMVVVHSKLLLKEK